MGLSTAERNRRKRERKKREREERRKQEEKEKELKESERLIDDDEVEVEYVAEKILAPKEGDFGAMIRFQQRAAAVISDDERNNAKATSDKGDTNDDDLATAGDDETVLSKRKLKEKCRPSVAELKQRVQRPDLVEAHDVTAPDPEFLVQMKSITGTVPVPRHWGRKRKYLQGKRGFEKSPYELPDFIVKTGIAEARDTLAEAESEQSAKQKNRARVAPKMGAVDVDYRTLHDAFFKHQTKPRNLTKFGDVYYESKEMEVKTNVKPGGVLSKNLRDALGMTSDSSPPPWLNNMQRYGPPPSYPILKVPGLNAPLPSVECQYGYHPGGWGKPPVDPYGRPLYGGNPFDPPGSSLEKDLGASLVTSDGKTITKIYWGALPMGDLEDEESDEEDSEEEESSADEMDESEEEEEGEEKAGDGLDSVLPPPSSLVSSTAPVDLRKQAGDETPMVPEAPKHLYKVIEQKKASSEQQEGAVFASDVAYVVPGATPTAAAVPEGAESVLSKAPPGASAKRKKADEGDDESDLGKHFKF